MQYRAFLTKIQGFIHHFLSTKTRREKYLLLIAISLCVIFIVLDFIYMPLLENYRTLTTLHSHTQKELKLSWDSLHDAKTLHLEQMHSLQAALHNLEDNLKLLGQHFAAQDPLLNPFTLMPTLIEFAKNHNLTLFSLAPYPTLNALSVEGEGSFDDIIALLSHIESHRFLSVDFLHLVPKDNAHIAFHILMIDHRLQGGKEEKKGVQQ